MTRAGERVLLTIGAAWLAWTSLHCGGTSETEAWEHPSEARRVVELRFEAPTELRGTGRTSEALNAAIDAAQDWNATCRMFVRVSSQGDTLPYTTDPAELRTYMGWKAGRVGPDLGARVRPEDCPPDDGATPRWSGYMPGHAFHATAR